MRILAVDRSLTRTGWCASLPEHLVTSPLAQDYDFGSIIPKTTGVERLLTIRREFEELLFKYSPELVVFEGYAQSRHNSYAHELGAVGGLMQVAVADFGVAQLEITPTNLKKWATGTGNAKKDAMIADAVRRFGFPGCDNNEADAFLLWQMANAAYGLPVRMTKPMRDALEVPAWPNREVAA